MKLDRLDVALVRQARAMGAAALAWALNVGPVAAASHRDDARHWYTTAARIVHHARGTLAPSERCEESMMTLLTLGARTRAPRRRPGRTAP